MSWSSAFMFRILSPVGGPVGFTTFPGCRAGGSFRVSLCKFSDSGEGQRWLFCRLKNRDDDLRNLPCGKYWSTGFWEPLLQLGSQLPAKRDQSGSSMERCSNANLLLIFSKCAIKCCD